MNSLTAAERRRQINQDIFIRPGRRTSRKPQWKLEELKQLEEFNFTEDGVPIARSTDDLLDEAFEQGVRAGLVAPRDRDEFAADGDVMERNPDEDPEQSYRRGLQQGAAEVLHALEKARALPDRLQRRISGFVYGDLWRFRYAKRQGRHIVRDHPPRLVISRTHADQ